MKHLRRILFVLILLAAANGALALMMLGSTPLGIGACLLLLVGFVYVNLRPIPKTAPTKRIDQLSAGCELLRLFLITATINVVWMLLWLPAAIRMAKGGGFFSGLLLVIWIIIAIPMVILEAILFWNGMIRVYLTSVQLGLKHRVLAALCGWVPFLNIWYLTKIIRIASDEVEFETEKWELDEVRAENEVCKTKYPILLVHGVFFRDFRYLNYWGRIPKELKRNGAVVYYGQQQSAASVEDSGRELAARIRAILDETGCEKVKIIADSKGGLDSRAAIAHAGCAPYVATLTTINTPHRGCIYAEYLLNKVPEAARQKVAAAYNATLKRLGDENPDFLAAVYDLTSEKCEQRNEVVKDQPGVYYQSFGSRLNNPLSGRFPLNMTYYLVKYFDGPNDGLVGEKSFPWGSSYRFLTVQGKRGISHGDMIDLNRENFECFDVREFYVELVADLKKRGL